MWPSLRPGSGYGCTSWCAGSRPGATYCMRMPVERVMELQAGCGNWVPSRGRTHSARVPARALSPCYPTAARYLATRSAGTRPRSLMSWPFSRAQARTATVSTVLGLRPGRAGARARRSADLAGVGNVAPERGTQLLVVLAAEVYFVFSAVQGEADGSVGLAAIDVVDEQGLDSLGHANYSVTWRMGLSSIGVMDGLQECRTHRKGSVHRPVKESLQPKRLPSVSPSTPKADHRLRKFWQLPDGERGVSSAKFPLRSGFSPPGRSLPRALGTLCPCMNARNMPCPGIGSS